jgi:hypothetical protein
VLSYREINRKPTAGDRAKLALVFVVGFGALGAHQLLKLHHHGAAIGFFVAAAALAVLALLPGIGRVVYIAWMGLGVTIGFFTQPIVLLVAYALLFVPIALVFKAVGRDMMKRKLLPRRESYWEEYDEGDELSSYFKQY